MVSVVTDLAKSIMEKLIDATIVQSRYICCFTCITEDLEKEKETLKDKTTTVGEYVKAANRRGEGIRSDVSFWQEQADRLIQVDTKTKVTCFFGWCPNCKWQYSRGKDLANKTEEIKKLMESNFESVGITRDIPDIEYHSSRDYISFKSRELKYKELLNALIDDNNYLTGLQGMGGTGKTTLAKQVGKELKKSKQFDQVIDTTVSYTHDIKKIQDDIAGPLGLPMKEYSDSERPKKLWSRLTNGEKILIILDDVWGDINFEDIGIPYNDNHNGCRILVSTRDLKICYTMGCDRTIQLKLLPEEDAWILFKKHAGISDSSSTSFVDKGRKIAQECKGLPVAIAAIASSLKGQQRQEEWNAALKSLHKSTPLHGDDENMGKIYKCLRYSYDNMNNEQAKGLFLLCCVFREDEELSAEILTRFSIGAGLVGEIDENYDEGRSQVVVAMNKLIDSCLLLKTEKGSVKMHDLVREVALWIANKEIQAVSIYNKNRKSLVEREKNIKYLLCEGKGMDVFSCRLDGSKLEILVVYMDGEEDDSVKVPNSFFNNMIKLRVLHLSDKGKTWKPTKLTLSLPQSIRSLTNIRSLFLERFELGDISILGNLQFLETLDLVDCLMDELPHEIAELEKLKLLKLYLCEFRRNNPFKVIERCSSLEELYFVGKFVFQIDSSAMHRKINLPMLQRFRIIEGYVDIYKQIDSMSNCLSLFKADDFFSEATFTHLVQSAKFLELFGLQGECRNLIPDIIPIEYEGTDNLVELVLTSPSQLQCLIDTKHIDSHVQNVFSKLVALTLGGMENLKELCSGPLPFELLKSLEKLRIRECINLQGILFKSKLTPCNLKTLELIDCPMLVSLFPLSTIRSLVLLDVLFIDNCEQLRSIITDERTRDDLGEEIVDADNDNKSCGSMFPNLKTLHISRCPQLDFILPVLSARDVPNLELVKIHHCVELKYIFGPNQRKHEDQDLHQEVKDAILVTLKEMELFGLPNFVDFFPNCDQSMCSSMKRSSSKDASKAQIQPDPIKMCSSMKRSSSKDASKAQMQSDSVKCNIFPWTHKYGHAQKLKSTKIPLDSKDQLQDCSISLVHDSKEENNLCLKEITEQQMNVRLQKIQLCDMPQMTCLFVGPKNYFTLQNLTELRIVRCEKMEVIFSASMLRFLPQLHNLGILECKELKQIIDGDLESHKMSYFLSPGTFFPRLKVLVVEKCNNLKCVFPISTSKELPKLELLVIKEASLLEEVFGCESGQKVETPNLKIVVFVKLPSLCQEIEFQNIKDRLVQNCPKVSWTSTLTRERFRQIIYSGGEGFESNEFILSTLGNMLYELHDGFTTQEISNENPIAKATEDFPIGTKVQVALGRELTSPQVNINQSIDANIAEYNKHENGIASDAFISVETQPSIAMSPIDSERIKRQSRTPSDNLLHKTHSHGLKEIEDQSTQDNAMSEKTLIPTLFIHPKMRKTSLGPLVTPLQKEIRRSDDEGTTSAYAKTISSSTGSESVSSLLGPLVTYECKIDPQDGEGQIATSFSVVNIEPAITKDVGGGDFQETSKSAIISHSETNAPVSENLSQIIEDSSFASIVTRELERLVSNKHLAFENLSLLSNFLLKHPYVRLTNKALSDRYKGFAYTCLAELLKFLQTHSVLDVLGSSHSELVELLQDVRRFAFDRDWLDGVERRALFPGLQMSEDALQTLLYSKQTLIQHLEDLKHQLEESMTQQEAQVLQVRATLSTPLGY